ncbi:MAG: hypothetical protein K6G12_11170 [Lachnospiraceae bacterium]|nr:hypothetical protein [Lachnospiraceae bacterium]
MDPSSAIMLAVGALVAAILIFIGIKQFRSVTPVAFYTGEEPPAEKLLKDVRAWNHGHGSLWIGYGVVIIVCYLLAVFWAVDSLVKTLLMFCGTIFPVFLLVLGHRYLVRRYMIW